MSELDWQSQEIDSNGLRLHLERAGPASGEPLVLIMGLGGQLIQWPERLCAELIRRGFQVIRFDNRDAGLSQDAGRGVRFNLRADYLRVRLGLPPGPANYLLHDMADDLVGLLDALDIERAHLVGASMGGMIAQLCAATYPQRVRSLCSIMSGTNHPWTLATDLKLLLRLSSPPSDHRRDTIVERQVVTMGLIGSPGHPTPEAERRAFAQRAFDRAFRPGGTLRQMHAIVATGGFEKRLHRITAPTLILHGREDPLQRLACGRRSARFIPGARLQVIDGMGHDFPETLMPSWAERITDNAHRAA